MSEGNGSPMPTPNSVGGRIVKSLQCSCQRLIASLYLHTHLTFLKKEQNNNFFDPAAVEPTTISVPNLSSQCRLYCIPLDINTSQWYKTEDSHCDCVCLLVSS